MIGQHHLHRALSGAQAIGFQRLNRSLMRLVPEPPPSPVRGLVQSDAVNPCLQGGPTVKVFHSAKHFHENFLGGVGRVRRVVHDAVHQSVDRLLKLADQPGVSLFRAGLQLCSDSGMPVISADAPVLARMRSLLIMIGDDRTSRR